MAEKTLKAFFKENVIKKAPVQYAASKRMVGEDGKPVPWEIRVLTNEEMDNLRDRSKELRTGRWNLIRINS